MRPLLFVVPAVLLVAAPLAGPAVAAGPNRPVVVRPAVHEKVSSQPDTVSIALLRKVDGPAVITVTDSSGQVVSEKDTDLVATNMNVYLRTGLPKGTYTVTYRFENSTGPGGGSYQFALGSGQFSFDGIRTFGGYDEIPKQVALPDDDEREKKAEAAASATPTTPPAPTPSSSGSAGSSDGQSSGDDLDAASETGSSSAPWVVAVLALLVLGAGAGAVVWRRRSAGDATG